MTTTTKNTTLTTAVELKSGDVIVSDGTSRKLFRVTGSSRAAASSPDRICIFLGDVDGSRIPGIGA